MVQRMKAKFTVEEYWAGLQLDNEFVGKKYDSFASAKKDAEAQHKMRVAAKVKDTNVYVVKNNIPVYAITGKGRKITGTKKIAALNLEA